MPTNLVIAIIGTIPAIAAPLISWLLPHRGFARRTRDLEALGKKVQLIERLVGLEEHLSEQQKKMLWAELADIAEDLVADRARVRSAVRMEVKGLSKLRLFLLLYDQPTTRASVYRVLFWSLWVFGLLGGLSLLTLTIAGKSDLDGRELPIAMLGTMFYLGLGLIFRSAARKQQKRARALAARDSSGVGSEPVVPPDSGENTTSG